MTNKLTRQAFSSMVLEDIDWLKDNAPDCQEKQHILSILGEATDLYYGNTRPASGELVEQIKEYKKHHQSQLPSFAKNTALVVLLDRAIAALTQPGKVGVSRECIWTGDVGEDSWETQCGDVFTFIEGGPKKNNCFFCHKCGGKLIEQALAAMEGEK